MSNNKIFTSAEELHFSWYLDELKKAGIISNIKYQPKSIILTDKVIRTYTKPMKRVEDKLISETLLPEKIYTPDFEFNWNLNHPKISKFIGDINNDKLKYTKSSPFILLDRSKNYGLIETKGNFDRNNMTRLFKQNQAFIYQRYGVYVNLVKLPDLFKNTFLPERYKLTDKSMKPRVIKFNFKSLTEYLND